MKVPISSPIILGNIAEKYFQQFFERHKVP